MISGRKLVYDFRRKYDASISGESRDLPLVDVVALLNEAQQIWFENRVMLAQTSSKIQDDLRPFIENQVEGECEKVDSDSCRITYPSDLYKRLNQVAIAKNCCCPEKRIIIRIVQSDDLHEARRNPYRKADFYFEQLLGNEWKDGLIIYHDGQMEIENVLIDYYRRPKDIHVPSIQECTTGYYDYNGQIITQDQDFEASSTFADRNVSDIAVLLASRDTKQLDQFQTQLSKILQIQSL